jgi:hypothetical protein
VDEADAAFAPARGNEQALLTVSPFETNPAALASSAEVVLTADERQAPQDGGEGQRAIGLYTKVLLDDGCGIGESVQ